MGTAKFTHQSVALSDQERRIIKDLMEGMGQTFSGALRFIVNDWQRLQEKPDDMPDLQYNSTRHHDTGNIQQS